MHQASLPGLTTTLLSILAALPSTQASSGFDCKRVVDDKVTWDLSPLGGPHTVHWNHTLPPTTHLWNFTLDICQPLKRTKDVPKNEECPTGTRVCAIETVQEEGHNETSISQVVPIAGDFSTSHGKPLDSVPTRLKYSDSHGDSEREGVRVALSGGEYDGKPQKAVIEFLCDPERSGLEGDEKDDRENDDSDEKNDDKLRRRDEKDDDKKDDKSDKKSLKFISYKDESVKDEVWSVLRLEWKTKYACEKKEDRENPVEGEPSTKNGWGFFSWFILM